MIYVVAYTYLYKYVCTSVSIHRFIDSVYAMRWFFFSFLLIEPGKKQHILWPFLSLTLCGVTHVFLFCHSTSR